MKILKKIGLISLFSFYIFGGFLFFSPQPVLAALVEVKTDLSFTPQIGIPSSEFTGQQAVQVGGVTTTDKGVTVMRSDLMARYIKAVYNWGLGIAAVIAVVTLMAGGLMWITSGGKGDNVSKAKKMITGSITGLLLLVGSYFILNTINPNLVNLPAIDTELIGKISDVKGCCVKSTSDKGRMTTETECKNDQGSFDANKVLAPSGFCEDKVCCLQNVNGADRCFETVQNCSPNTLFLQKGACSQALKCTSEYTVNCATQEDGSLCAGIPNCYCYNGIALTGQGKLLEPCGVKFTDSTAGICIKQSDNCNDVNDYGGRDCDDSLDLKCCLDAGIW